MYYTKLFLIALHYLCRIFYVEMFQVNYPGDFFRKFRFPGNNFHGKSHFWTDRETD